MRFDANIYTNLKFDPMEPAPDSRVGIALKTIGAMPVHGLRHPFDGETNGWYLWCGEYSDDSNFFQPLHVEHLSHHLPQVEKFLSLPPGYRFLIDDSGYEDIWFDESLLKV